MNTTTSTIVPFHGSNLIIVSHDGEPCVAMRPVVEGMGLSWATQTVKLKNPKWGCFVIETPSDGGPQTSIGMPLRKLNGWLFSINPLRVRTDKRAMVESYQEECFTTLHDYWTKGHAVNPRLTQPAQIEVPKPDPMPELDRGAALLRIANGALHNVRFLLTFDRRGNSQVIVVPFNSTFVDADDLMTGSLARLGRLVIDSLPLVPPKEEAGKAIVEKAWDMIKALRAYGVFDQAEALQGR